MVWTSHREYRAIQLVLMFILKTWPGKIWKTLFYFDLIMNRVSLWWGNSLKSIWTWVKSESQNSCSVVTHNLLSMKRFFMVLISISVYVKGLVQKSLKIIFSFICIGLSKGNSNPSHCRAEGTVCRDWRYHSTFMGLTGYHHNKKTVRNLPALKQEGRPGQLSQFSHKNNGLEWNCKYC